MKNKKTMVPIFDEALRQAGRDFAKEMGHKGETRNDLTKIPAGNQGVVSGVIRFIKAKMQLVKR